MEFYCRLSERKNKVWIWIQDWLDFCLFHTLFTVLFVLLGRNDLDSRRTMREISDNLKRLPHSDPVAMRVEDRLQAIQNELRSERQSHNRYDELVNLSTDLRQVCPRVIQNMLLCPTVGQCGVQIGLFIPIRQSAQVLVAAIWTKLSPYACLHICNGWEIYSHLLLVKWLYWGVSQTSVSIKDQETMCQTH